jgi:hypothetical protein
MGVVRIEGRVGGLIGVSLHHVSTSTEKGGSFLLMMCPLKEIDTTIDSNGSVAVPAIRLRKSPLHIAQRGRGPGRIGALLP